MKHWLDPLLRPRRAARRGCLGPSGGFGALALLGAAWAALMALLALGGHQPSMSRGLVVPAERYYAVASLYLVPLCLLLGEIYARVSVGLAGGPARLRRPLRVTFATAVGLLFVLPDLVACLAFGFEALGPVLRITAPFTAGWLTVSASVQLRAEAHIGWGRALGAALVALGAQALVAAPLLR